MASFTVPSAPPTLLTIPSELRLMIYHHEIGERANEKQAYVNFMKPPPLLFTYPLMQEARRLYYAHNDIRFPREDINRMELFFNSIGSENSRRIKHVQASPRWSLPAHLSKFPTLFETLGRYCTGLKTVALTLDSEWWTWEKELLAPYVACLNQMVLKYINGVKVIMFISCVADPSPGTVDVITQMEEYGWVVRLMNPLFDLEFRLGGWKYVEMDRVQVGGIEMPRSFSFVCAQYGYRHASSLRA